MEYEESKCSSQMFCDIGCLRNVRKLVLVCSVWSDL